MLARLVGGGTRKRTLRMLSPSKKDTNIGAIIRTGFHFFWGWGFLIIMIV